MPKIQSLQSRFAPAPQLQGVGGYHLISFGGPMGGFRSWRIIFQKSTPNANLQRFFRSSKQKQKSTRNFLLRCVFFSKAILVRDTGVAHICFDGTTLSLHLESSTRFCNFEPIADGIATSWFGVTRYLGKSWNVVGTCPNEPQFS